MPYRWGGLPNPLTIHWMAYSDMFEEFALGLANEINAFTGNVRRLAAWAEVARTLCDEDRLQARIEFVDTLATTLVNAPYAIRSRFIFATAQLCHQANRAKDPCWVDDFPLDQNVYFDVADLKGAPWRKRYFGLKTRLESIANRAYNDALSNFRHAYTHRSPPDFVIGLSRYVTRTVSPATGRPAYGFGETPALELDLVVDQLVQQRDRMYLAFDAFAALIRAHEASIAEYIAAQGLLQRAKLL